MIDTDAFGEWIVAKAAKNGAFQSSENLRIAREAAQNAVARDGDDIHVACVLAGTSGAVHVDERMTRTAVIVLFPKVAVAHPVPLFVPRDEKPPAPAPSHDSEDYERIERRRRQARRERYVLVLVAVVVGLVLAAAIVGGALKEHEHEEPSPAKREMRH
jgi:hypothetical protein